MDYLEGPTGGKARVEYVYIQHVNDNDIVEIHRIVEMVEESFNPPDAPVLTFVGMLGDQPVYKAIFKTWLDAYVKRDRRFQELFMLTNKA